MTDEVKAKVTIELDDAGANDAIDKLKEMQALAGSTGDALSQTAGNAGELGKQFSTVAEETAGFSKALDELAAPASATSIMLPEIASSFEEMRPAVEGATTSIEELYKPLDQATGLLESASPAMAQLTEHASSLGTEISPVAAGLVQVQEALGQTVPLLPQYAESMKAVTTSATAMGPAIDHTQENISALDQMLSSNTPFVDMKNHLAETGQSFSDLAATVDPQKLSSFFDRIDQMAVQSTPAIAAYGDAVQAVGQSFTEASPPSETFQKNVDTLNAAIQSTPAIAAYGDAVQAVGQSFTEASPPSEAFQKTIIPGQFQTAEEYLAQLNSTVAETGSISTQTTQPLENLGATVSESGMAAKQAQTPFNNFQGTIASTGEAASQFAGQFTSSLADVQKGINSFGGVGSAQYGPALSMSDQFKGVLEGIGSNALGFIDQIAMPMMVAQQVAAVVSQAFQGIYTGAVTQEGAAAHTVGSFTGAVDALGQTGMAAGNQMAESIGKQMIPSLDAMNSTMSQSSTSANQWGKSLGGAADFMTNLGLIVGGVTPGVGLVLGPGAIDTGIKGFQNEWAQSQGQPLPNQGPPAQRYAAQDAQLLQQAQDNYAMATDPQYMATQQSAAYLAYKTQQAVQQVAMYDTSHWSGSTGFNDPNNAVVQGAMVRSTGQSYGGGVDPNAAYFYGLLGQAPYTNEASAGGCFIAGTLVLCRDNKERKIEELRVGDQIIGRDGAITTVLACISYPRKQTYELIFADNTMLTLSDSHPLASLHGWKTISPASAREENPGLFTTILKPGDHIYTRNGMSTLLSINVRDVVQVYNISVDGNHAYYANGVLVHNAKSSLSPSTVDSSGSITKNVPLTVTWSLTGLLDSVQKQTSGWSLSGILDQISKQTSGWSLSGILDQISKQTSGWGLIGELAQTSMQNSGWGLIGQLVQMSTQNSGWGLVGDLVKTTEQVSNWALSGELNKQWDAAVNWAVTGQLDKTFQGDVKWAATGLEHTFNAVATWVASNLNPVFQVAATFLGLASGVIDNPQSQIAMVGESGPELMYVPQGASIFPNGVNPLATGIGGIGSGSPGTSFGGGNSGSGPVTIQLHVDSMMLAQQILPQIAPLMRVQFGTRR